MCFYILLLAPACSCLSYHAFCHLLRTCMLQAALRMPPQTAFPSRGDCMRSGTRKLEATLRMRPRKRSSTKRLHAPGNTHAAGRPVHALMKRSS
jgi:hypothetical protein